MNRHLTDDSIQDYFDGILSPTAGREIERHLADCVECTAALEEVQELRIALRSLPRRATPPGDPGATLTETPEGRTSGTGRSSPGIRTLARAAVLAAVFAGGLLVGGQLEERFTPGGSTPALRSNAMSVATEVQRTGSAYAAAVAALADVEREPEVAPALDQGREATLAGLYAATLAYTTLAPRDVEASRILEAVESARRRTIATDRRTAVPSDFQ
jgi:anti-sigma factor RsiW